MALCCVATVLAAAASRADQVELRSDMREAIVRVPATVQDPFGKVVQGELLVTTFRPEGAGPFPLVVISHGRKTETRASYERQRYESASRYFLRKGFAVAVPLRLGYGELADAGDPESSVSCTQPRFASALDAAAQQIATVAQFMQQQPDIDPQRLLLVGTSVGGVSTLAATALRMPGQVAAIDFAGGHGGDPEKHPGEPCGERVLRQLHGRYGALNAATGHPTPTLWIYAENDHYFGPRHARAWAKAYAEAGGQVDLRVLPVYGADGHKLFTTGNQVWQPLVDEFLLGLGYDVPGALVPPPIVAQQLPMAEQLPVRGEKAEAAFAKFLAATPPKAFAINPLSGRWGYAQGDDAWSRALALCDKGNADATVQHPRCRLYALNEQLVWNPQ